MKWNALNNCLQSFWRNKTLVLTVGDFSSSFIFHSRLATHLLRRCEEIRDIKYNSDTLIHVHTLFFSYFWLKRRTSWKWVETCNMKEIKETWTYLCDVSRLEVFQMAFAWSINVHRSEIWYSRAHRVTLKLTQLSAFITCFQFSFDWKPSRELSSREKEVETCMIK